VVIKCRSPQVYRHSGFLSLNKQDRIPMPSIVQRVNWSRIRTARTTDFCSIHPLRSNNACSVVIMVCGILSRSGASCFYAGLC
jgi:hypothetical protein